MTGISPSTRYIDVDTVEREIRVKLGWNFNASIPFGEVDFLEHEPDKFYAFGINTNLCGELMANGSMDNLVRIKFLHTLTTGKILGCISHAMKSLVISVDDPKGFQTVLERALNKSIVR